MFEFYYHQIIAVGVLLIGGAFGGFFAAIFTPVSFPISNEENNIYVGKVQEFFRSIPVITLVIFGAVGGLLAPFAVATVSGVFGDDTVAERVLGQNYCGQFSDAFEAYTSAISGATFDQSKFQTAMSQLEISGTPNFETCDNFLHDLMMLFGVSLVVGFSLRAVVPSLSNRLLSSLDNVDKAAENANQTVEKAESVSNEAARKVEELTSVTKRLADRMDDFATRSG